MQVALCCTAAKETAVLFCTTTRSFRARANSRALLTQMISRLDIQLWTLWRITRRFIRYITALCVQQKKEKRLSYEHVLRALRATGAYSFSIADWTMPGIDFQKWTKKSSIFSNDRESLKSSNRLVPCAWSEKKKKQMNKKKQRLLLTPWSNIDSITPTPE